MKELPGDVFVTGQLLPAQMKVMAEQGVLSFINNRPDMEIPGQPLSEELENIAQGLGIKYAYIPMASGLTQDLIETSEAAYRDLPRPIVAFCASGTRSTALWAFAHVKALGVEAVMRAIGEAGYNLEHIRGSLTDYHAQNSA